MKIATGICEYGDTDGLYRCLASLGLDEDNGIDLAIIIHGRFNNFNLNRPTAYEDTKRIISRFPKDRIDLVRPINPPIMTEVESRNLYLQRATELNCDWLLVIDSDEFLAHDLTNWTLFREQLDFIMKLGLNHHIYDVKLDGNIPAYHGPVPRLFYRPSTVKYWGKHYWWVIEESKRLLKGQSDAARILEGIHIIHDHTIRDSKYYTASINYKDWQQNHEGEEVETHDKPPEIQTQMEKLKLRINEKQQEEQLKQK